MLNSCTSDCNDQDKACLKKKVLNHRARHIDFYSNYLDKPVSDKVFHAPKELIDFVNLDNRKIDIPNRAYKSKYFDKIAPLTQRALDELPNVIKSKFSSKLIGIFLLDDLGSTGFTDMAKDSDGNIKGAFIILDAEVLAKRSANQWASWKENTPFTEGELKVSLKIENNENDNIKNAIQYILLHELGHVVAINTDIHPAWDREDDQLDLSKYPFTALSWSLKDKELISQFQRVAPKYRPYKTLNYYYGERLDNSEMIPIYNFLSLTNIPTLYGVMNTGDDWAESFVTYAHSVLMKKPFKLTIVKEDKVIYEHQLCYFNANCPGKLKYLENYFNSSSQ